MAEPLKNRFGPEVPKRIAATISAVHPQFDSRGFIAAVLDGFEALELMPRARHIAAALRRFLPKDYSRAANILIDSLGPKLERDAGNGMAPFFYLPHVFYVAAHGLDHFELSMRAQYELTQRFTAEFSIRPYLIHHPQRTLKTLATWSEDASVHVRRLVSEGTRPRLPWAMRLPAFQRDPQPVLALLERLKDDPELYVRRSVANNLNDIGKDNPDALLKTAARWLKNAPAPRAALVRHALRSSIKAGDQMLLMSNGVKSEVKEVGIFTPKMEKVDVLRAGDVGYVVSNIKSTADIKIGDTITLAQKPASEMLPGYKEVRPMVFCGLYPVDTSDYEKLKAALGRLRLNDAAFVYASESSLALGFGFRCGFLGLLHMEIIQERIRREHDVDIISTYPSVVYRVVKHGGLVIEVDNPVNLPDPGTIEEIREPTIKAAIHIPNDAMGDILALIMEKRGVVEHTDTLDATRVMLTCILPLNEILVDFNDRLKSITHGYGSMDYELGEYRASDLVKMEILVNEEAVDAFASIVHREKAEGKGRELCEKLADIIPPQMFKVAIQAAVGGKIIARDNVKEMRKDVTAKCYGGDISRKRKLLDKQKEGKKKMKQFGRVSIPSDAFIKVLKTN